MEPSAPAEKKVASLIRKAIPGLKNRVSSQVGEDQTGQGRADLSYRLGNREVKVEVKSVRAPRVEDVKGRLSMAVLQLRRLLRSEGDVPVAIVVLDRYGSHLEEQVRRFMAENAPGVGWGLLDGRGQAVLEIPALNVHWRRAGTRDLSGLGTVRRGERHLFTDLNRWMLKVLLLHGAPDGAWAGVRAMPRHATELASIARVSVEKAHRFARAFEEEGFLVRTQSGLRLARVATLLETWLQQESGVRHQTLDVRYIPSMLRERDLPMPSEGSFKAALGGAYAAERLGVRHSSGPAVPLVHVSGSFAAAAQAWDLEVVVVGEPSLRLRKPRYPESVFRATVTRSSAVPLVDAWQSALDTVTSEARGLEQAQFLAKRVLAWQELA